MPRQRLPFRQKTKEWRKNNLDFADKHSFYHNEEVRQTLRNKIINLNLYNGIVDVRDLTNVVNPNNIDASYVPDNIPHHPIIVPKIDLLVGEAAKRRFDWSVIVTDPDSISAKEEAKKAFLKERLISLIQQKYSEEEFEGKLQELEKHMKYSYRDLREKMANQILKYYYQQEKFDEKFLKGFKDALIMAEEIYLVDIFFDEPRLTKLNPLKVHAIRSGNSDRFEDSSIIIIEDYKSPNQLVDEYFDELKPSDIDYIMDYSTNTSKGSYSDDQDNHVLFRDSINQMGMYDSLFTLAEINGHYFGSDYTDENGNIRELKVRWKSLRKIQKIKYYDEFGETQYRFESEEYIPLSDLGEESTALWVNEAWEGVKLGKDIYLKMKPLSVQFTNANNPSKGHLGIIGQIYNTNQGRAVSLIDRAKNYQYMYDAIFDRLNKAIAANYGKIMTLDLAKVPNNWEIEKWMHFAVVNKIAVVDSFKEGNHGAATGKLAGSMNNNVGGGVIDMETGSYIQQHIQLLEFIKMEMGEICGVTRQREGQISNRETVGGVERSVNQSSHITEYWFVQHESLKIRVLEAFLEIAKEALRNNPKKVQYILDDQTIEVLNMDDEQFSEADYAIVVSNTTRGMELEQAIKQYAQAFVQNGGSLSTIMDIYFSPSLLDMKRKLENAEEELHQRNSEMQQQQIEQQAQAAQAAMELENRKLDLEDLTNQRDNETKIYIKELELQSREAQDPEVIDDSLDREKLDLQKKKDKDDLMIKIKTLNQDMKKHEDLMKAKKVDQSINRIKKKSTS
jgi:hypothetical protein